LKLKVIYKTIAICLLLSIVIQGCHLKKEVKLQQEPINDSISVWMKLSKNKSNSLVVREKFLKKSYETLKLRQIDTVVSRKLSEIAYQFLNINDTINFKSLNEEAYQLALKLKDTFTLADTHWNYSNYYTNRLVYDSAYHHYNKAYEFFESINHEYYAAKMLYNMAFIRGRFRDYTGSEGLIIQAISKYKFLKKHKALYSSYNHLSILQKELGEYDKALFYHKKATEYLNKVREKKGLYESSLNDGGLIYHDKGAYKMAISYFNVALNNDSLKFKNIKLYAKLIDNRAYTKLLNKDSVNIKQEFYEALKIRDSLEDREGVLINILHLSEYYNTYGDTISAIYFGKKANVLAKEIKNNRDYLASLKLLSNLDVRNGKEHLNKYIVFNDSLLHAERKIQNKFTRISYETDEYIEETRILVQQKIWILVTGLGVLLALFLMYFLKVQQSKNERLILETEQQQANEEIYILTLKQQAKLEEEKIKERNRISEELHDGVLGKLFGTRVGLGFLDIKGSSDTLKQHHFFLNELQDIEKEIREVSHKLNNNFNISEINFVTIINQFLENKSKIGNFTYQFNNSEDIAWRRIDEKIKVNLYRILQEALQNCIKYAEASIVILDFSIENRKLVIKVIDNGVGFVIKSSKKGIGIKNIKSRIEKLNGVFHIYSEINKGTTIHFTIPI